MEKPNDSEQAEQARQSIWRRDTESRAETEMRNQLDQMRRELERTTEHARDIESKCEEYENLARTAESRYRDAVRNLKELQELQKLREISADESKIEPGIHHSFSTADLDRLEREGHPEATSPSARDALVSRILEGNPNYLQWMFVGSA